jgi:hypothetical protein
VIAAGVSLRRSNLIDAKTIVTGDTPDNVFVAGLSAKVINERKDNPSKIKQGTNKTKNHIQLAVIVCLKSFQAQTNLCCIPVWT